MNSVDSNHIILSIGIPVFNSEQYIGKLLERLVRINSDEIEIIVVNDGSNDNSMKIIKEYKSKYKKMKLFDQKNGGPSKARNKIIDNASGKWITFIDSDDYVDEKLYRELAKRLEDDYDWYINISDKKSYKRLLNSINKKDKLISLMIESEFINSPCEKFYKANVLEEKKIRFNSEFILGEDFLFNMEYSKYANNIQLVNESLYMVTENPDSITRNYHDGKYEQLMHINEKVSQMYNNNKRIQNSLLYIKVKNCLSCLRDCKRNEYYERNYINKVVRTKLQNKIILNNLFTTMVCLLWRILPASILMKVLR